MHGPGMRCAAAFSSQWDSRYRPALIAVLLILSASAASICDAAPAKDRPVISRGVERTLSDPGAEPRLPTGRLRVWVRFSDKGLDGTGAGEKSMSRALARAESELGSRSRIRRAKMAGEGKAELVDFTDLPIHAPYTRAVAGTGALMRRESRWLNAVSCDATPRQVALISELPGVAEITLVRQRARPGEITGSAAGSAANAEPDAASAATRTVVTETYDYGSSLSELQQINVPAVHELGITGAGVLIGMLDSGFKTTHQALADVDVFDKWDFVNADPIVENEVDDPWDAHSHGTMTLSTIGGRWEGRLVGVAPDAGFVLAKTEETGSESAIEEDNWVAGIEWLESVGVDIVNSSLGYRDWYDFSDLDGNTAACTIAADLAVGKGVIVVNSAGNDRDNDWGDRKSVV